MFVYLAGSLFQALKPESQLQPVNDEPWVADLDDAYAKTVSVNDQVYGAPFGSAFGGGILYNKKVYEKLGLEIPKTWDEFMANNAKVKAAGIDPVIQSYGETWTSQLFVLADYHNVAAEVRTGTRSTRPIRSSTRRSRRSRASSTSRRSTRRAI